jgi:hypothetical protein
MSYRYERYRERPRRRRGLATLVVLVWVLLLALLAIRFVGRPLVTNLIQDRIAQRMRVEPRDSPSVPGDPASLSTNASGGPITITEQAANEWIAAHRQELRGVDDVRLRFVPGEAQADVSAAGLTSTASGGIAVVDGQVRIVNPQLGMPLGALVDVKPLADLLEQRLNADLKTTGRQVTGVTIEQGQLQIAVQ